MKTYEGKLTGTGGKFAIVVSRFNDFIGTRLVDGAVDTLLRHDVQSDQIEIAKVPGAFEIPLAAQKLASSGNYEAIICLGAVIKGQTSHYEYVSAEVSKGIANVMLNTGTPVIFGVITTLTLEQAIERAGSKAGNKGAEAASCALEMANLLKQI